MCPHFAFQRGGSSTCPFLCQPRDQSCYSNRFCFLPKSTTELLEGGVGLKITFDVPCALFSHTRSAPASPGTLPLCSRTEREGQTDAAAPPRVGTPEGTTLQMATREEKDTALTTCLGTKESTYCCMENISKATEHSTRSCIIFSGTG